MGKILLVGMVVSGIFLSIGCSGENVDNKGIQTTTEAGIIDVVSDNRNEMENLNQQDEESKNEQMYDIDIKTNVEKFDSNSKEDSKTNISHYSNLADFKRIELYVWKDNDKYCFGLMSGTNRIKTTEERLDLKKFPLTIEEVDSILNSSPKVAGGIVQIIDNSINDKDVDDLKDILSNYSALAPDGIWRISN